VREARRQGVEVRPVDVCASAWDCTLEPGSGGEPALRLGLRLVKGLSRAAAAALVAARGEDPWCSLADLVERAGLGRRDLQALAGADALATLVGHRHLAAWEAAGLPRPLPLAPAPAGTELLPLLPPPGEGTSIAADYASLGLSLRRHPLALLRGELDRRRVVSAAKIGEVPAGRQVHTAGLVITRQRPASANSVTFVTLEDETGCVNLVVWKRVAERQRKALLGARLLGAVGEVQRESGVTHLVVSRLQDYSSLLGGLVILSRDFQ
jgi:error-prone DNA polymerase